MALRNKMQYSTLKDLKPGIEAVIVGIFLEKEWDSHVGELGIILNYPIKKTHNFLFGSSVIEVIGSRYAIGEDLSRRIIVGYEQR